jgi:hypothetical protein
MTGSSPSVAIDNTGALAFHFLTYTDGIPASHTIGRIGSNGTLVFSTTGASLSGTRPTVAYDPAGNVIAMSGLVDANGEGGLRLEQLSPAGAPLWALDKLPHEPSQNLPVFRIRDVVVDGTGSLAVVGSYSPVTDAPGAWIAIYQP